ncbi:MAG: hypothetical protein WAL56_24145 [Candidatus Sulfotelmatobacter sp.]
MPRYDVAHVREQGTNLIIIPLNSSFGQMPKEDQAQEIATLQKHANGAGLAGTVVPVWEAGGGRIAFIAPQQWHPFFSSINGLWLANNINKWISW